MAIQRHIVTTTKIDAELSERQKKTCILLSVYYLVTFISIAKTNIYPFLLVLEMFVWSFNFTKACLDKKSSAVYILANVTLRQRTVLVWGVKLCIYCTPAAALITCWRLKASEGYFFITARKKNLKQMKGQNSLCLLGLLNCGKVQLSSFLLQSHCHREGFRCFHVILPWFSFLFK